jgi:NAD(P)-dependent dehydrogenase (short-subunit alcohol dehydrogenase family)
MSILSLVSVAVVTGAGGAIGGATAAALAEAGHSIVALDVDGRAAAATAAAVDGRWFECDVADRAAVLAAAAEIGPVETLVNVAGISRPGALLTSSPADVMAVLGVNLLGTLWCTQAFGPGMATGGGVIVNVSSGAAKMHMPFLGIYPASKSAIEALTVQLAVEMGPLGVRVNAVAPGTVLTPAVDAMLSEADKDARRRHLPVGRLGTPTDIAAAVVFLASSAAGYISGQVLYVDGGLTAGQSRRD